MALETDISERAAWWPTAAEPDWDAVYAEQMPRIYNYFRYRFGDDTLAEELTARTFEKAWAARRRYRRDLARFATWLVTIARNVGIDHLRSFRSYQPLETVPEVADEGTPESDQARNSDLARLRKLIGDLPKREQELLALKYGAEESNRNIARLTGLSESNVGTVLHRAVKMLREKW